MEVKYIVNGIEFLDKKQAKKYEESLALSNAKFKEGQTVYFWDSADGFPVEATIAAVKCDTFNNKPRILYKFNNWVKYKSEPTLFASWDELTDFIRKKCRDIR